MEEMQIRLPVRGLTFEDVWAAILETDRQLKEQALETDRQLKEQAREIDRQLKETGKQIDKTARVLEKNMSDLGRKFGKIIEHMFIPNLEKKFRAFGFDFGKAAPNVRIGNREHNIYMEIDVFLENGDSALAVEVKAQANINDIREHVERMEKLRRYFDLTNDRRKLYGAVAAAILPENVLDFALKQGFFVIEQSGEQVDIRKPEGNAKAW
jgi:hypothetical protein